MFLSTVVPSTRLNVNNSKNISPYNFSVPYNFVRGRNIILSINPTVTTVIGNSTGSLVNDTYGKTNANTTNPNTYFISIPDGVTSYSTVVTVTGFTAQSNGWHESKYTLNVDFDLTQGIITFTPTAYTAIGTLYQDGCLTSAALIVISTIL